MRHQPPAGAEHVVAGADQAVGLRPPCGRPAPRRSPRASPGARRSTSPFSISIACGTPICSAKRWCACRWRASPCTGTEILGLIQRYICSSSSRQGWPGDVDEMVALGDHLDALADQLVVQVVEGALVAGDDLGAEDHRVAGLEPHPRVLAGGDPDQGAARLALAAGAEIEHACCAAAARPRARRGSAARPCR